MKKLYIIGARGFGREVYNLARETNSFINGEYEIAGFLDDDKNALDDYDGYPLIISSVEEFTPNEDDVFACALGDVGYKKKYVDIILSKGGRFINLIHEDAYISKNAKIGFGCIICAHVRISCDTEIGNFNTFQPFTAVGHDTKIGSFCHFNTYSFMGGFVNIGNLVTLHTGAIIHPHKKVNDKAVVGAGALVIRNVPPNTSVFGNPAKKIEY